MGKSKKKRRKKKLEAKKLKAEAKAHRKADENTVVIDPADLQIFESPEGMGLRKGGHVILLDAESPLMHPRLKLLEHIREEFDGFGLIAIDEKGVVVKPSMISSYMLLGVQRRMEKDPGNTFVAGFSKWLLFDPCLSRCAGPECVDQIARWQPLYRFYESESLNAPDFAQIPVDENCNDVDSILKDRAGHLFVTNDPQEELFIEGAKKYVKAVDLYFRNLGPEEWAAMWLLHSFHEAILFPLLLVTGRCSAQEYANGLMAGHCLLTTAFGDVDVDAHAKQVRGFREDAQIVLQFLENARSPWTKEILLGEDDRREFKSSLRYDLETHQHNKDLEHSVLKNVAAFLNGDGGTIFVGVGDSGEIHGIELDGFENDDKWSLHLVNRIGQQLGKRFITLCSVEFDTLHGKSVSRITVRRSDEPAYLDERALKAGGKQAAFFIRGGPSAQKLSPEESVRYIATRFPSLEPGAMQY